MTLGALSLLNTPLIVSPQIHQPEKIMIHHQNLTKHLSTSLRSATLLEEKSLNANP